jgi:hypothetical protein
MIIKEFYETRKDGVNLYRTFSDEGLKIRKIGTDWLGNPAKTDEIYDEAIDVENASYRYEETDIPIETGNDA